MRLLKYISKSGLDEQTNKFRLLNIGLTDKPTKNSDIIKTVTEKNKLDKSPLDLINELNKILKKEYRGKYRFDFILEEKSVQIDNIKIKKEVINKIKAKYYNILEEFNNIKQILEKK